ncbi:hypothetical protein H072_5592 [Dactylellina haptotyla CBS 200.50]|uniref:Transcriptional regulatory protein DEP1 n=1 Tax=Dactylellina haptotyla (strain CBS 200.50) TaxID=1284197 RepID=S8BM57_DACHA|nr:hypothetical protein H072_5592 [Dactylellina haptotyla CBS 200.50]
MRTSSRRGSKRSRTASVLRDEEELPPPTRKTGTPKFSPAPLASEPEEPDRELPSKTLAGKPSSLDDTSSTTPLPEPESAAADTEKQTLPVSEVTGEPITGVLPPTATTTTTTTTSASTSKQANGSEKGSTEEDEEDAKSSPLTETSSPSDQMASVAVFPASAHISLKGVRTMDDLEMGNTESDRPSPDRSSAPPSVSRTYLNGQSPESSSLSELDSDDDDSEAETERLNISPQKPAPGNTTNSASYSTPKKSIGESTLTSPSRSPSPLSTPGQESPKSPDREMTLGAIEQLTPEGSIAGSPIISPGRKRKRTELEGLDNQVEEETKDIMEISDLEDDPPKKKMNKDDSKSPPSDDEEEEVDGEDDTKDTKGKRSDLPSTNGHLTDAEEDSVADDDESGSPVPANRSPDKGKSKSTSAKSSPKKKFGETDVEEDPDEENTDAADSNQPKVEDEEADEMSKTKRAAAEDLATIEILFAQLRDKIVEERVAEIDKEIAMVQDGTHPELVLMSQAIETHKKEKLDKANTLLGFQLETAEQERMANRAAIWAQYSQEIRETREKCFSEANKLWWAIHRERRAADTSVSDYVYKIPKSISTQINHRSRYNAEVSLLSGIAKHVGFPAAPTIMGATSDEVRADLEAMGVRTVPDFQLVPAQVQAPIPPPPPPSQHYPTSTLPQASGPSRLPQMSTFGPPSGYSPRPAKALAPPPQLGNAFQHSPSSHALNPETRHPRNPPSPIPQLLSSFHQTQKSVAPPSPRMSKPTKMKTASKPVPQPYDTLGDPAPPKRVPIKLEQSPTISSLSFTPSSQNYITQQSIDRRVPVVGAPTYRPFGK